jgi:hypothetical protein
MVAVAAVATSGHGKEAKASVSVDHVKPVNQPIVGAAEPLLSLLALFQPWYDAPNGNH